MVVATHERPRDKFGVTPWSPRPVQSAVAAVGVSAVRDVDDGDSVLFVVDSVDHPVGAATYATSILQRRL